MAKFSCQWFNAFHHIFVQDQPAYNTRGGTRTHNPRLRRPMLYPIELHALGVGRAKYTLVS